MLQLKNCVSRATIERVEADIVPSKKRNRLYYVRSFLSFIRRSPVIIICNELKMVVDFKSTTILKGIIR